MVGKNRCTEVAHHYCCLGPVEGGPPSWYRGKKESTVTGMFRLHHFTTIQEKRYGREATCLENHLPKLAVQFIPIARPISSLLNWLQSIQ